MPMIFPAQLGFFFVCAAPIFFTGMGGKKIGAFF
jgi:hypothetical protein